MISSEYLRMWLLLSSAVILRANWHQISRLRCDLPYTIVHLTCAPSLTVTAPGQRIYFFQILTRQFSELLAFTDSIPSLQVVLHSRFLILKYGSVKLFVTEMYHIKSHAQAEKRKRVHEANRLLRSLCIQAENLPDGF